MTGETAAELRARLGDWVLLVEATRDGKSSAEITANIQAAVAFSTALVNAWPAIDGMLARLAAAEAELEEHRQAMWDIDAILGFDHDGDPTPRSLAYPSLIEYCTENARGFREDYDDLLDELPPLTLRDPR